MSDSRAAAAIDRLPWLDDEPQTGSRSRLKRRSRWLASSTASRLWRWAPPLLAALAGASFWLGSRTAPDDEFAAPVGNSPAEVSAPATIALPMPQATEMVRDAPIATEQADARAIPAQIDRPRIAPPRVRHGRVLTRRVTTRTAASAAVGRAHAVRPRPDRMQYWPARVSAGASGRMVRIGTFSSTAQAKKGWHRVVAVYPGMAGIPAVVVPLRSQRDGHVYFRLQMGTTSQAHSEILCQRMRIIGQSCVVVGLGGSRGES